MTAFKVRNLWTAFVTAFFALLASVGLTTASAAPARPAVATPDEPAAPRTEAVRTAAVPAQSRRTRTPLLRAARDRSLPPTMKQRISAEAHGASPATRHLPTAETEPAAIGDAGSPGTAARTADSAPVRDTAVPKPARRATSAARAATRLARPAATAPEGAVRTGRRTAERPATASSVPAARSVTGSPTALDSETAAPAGPVRALSAVAGGRPSVRRAADSSARAAAARSAAASSARDAYVADLPARDAYVVAA